MKLYILGICGTFMGGIAQLAKAMGMEVSGADLHVYPPMSTQLEQAGIELHSGWDPHYLPEDGDQIIIGNALSRGNPMVEAVLNRDLNYTSGPQWLAEHILSSRWVLAVAGTHGKTSTASMLAWILDYAGLQPGFLIGGVPKNFGESARLGSGPFFVVEADEYDTAFFDKRAKFIHYRPRTLIINNIEFDHADIYDDLAQIQTQFHHLIRTVPGEGLIIAPSHEPAVKETLDRGCWTPVAHLHQDWQVQPLKADGSQFAVIWRHQEQARIQWQQKGSHNLANALAAIAAAHHVGVPISTSAEALQKFIGVKRRLELIGEINGIRIYDDFAHHPTAIATTLEGLRASTDGRLIAVLEPRSNTMKLGVHKDQLPAALATADQVIFYQSPQLDWSIEIDQNWQIMSDTQAIIDQLLQTARSGDHIIIMSNGGFENIHQRLLAALAAG